MIKIEEFRNEDMNMFLDYLTIHLSENGNNNFLFQPLSKEQSKIGRELEEKFNIGFNRNFGDAGWRKLWLARNQENEIVGHIDIRSRNELNAEHRVLLGMGVDNNYRNLKIGQRLIEFVIAYSKNQPKISWIDLEVLTTNIPAVKLYEKMKFQVLSNTVDMFRIEDISYDYTSMTLNV